MHLPPLDVAVYPVVTMSHGRQGGRTVHPSSALSSSFSTASSASSQSRNTTPNFSSIQKVIQRTFRSSKIRVQQAERIQGRLHQVYLARLADGTALVIKCPPNHSTRMLRHEKQSIESECRTLETLHEYTQLPVPQVIKYDGHGGSFGTPFLLTNFIQGRKLSELAPYLSPYERDNIDRALGAYTRTITSLSATQFGFTHRVFAKKGSTSWREAFLTLLEFALRDAEDMLVTVPYESIRGWVGKHIHVLDEVTEPRLVALNVCDPSNVLIDEQSKLVSGLMGFSDVIWGDPLMCGGIEGGSQAFFEGYGECPARTVGIQARMLIYTTYRATVQIVAHHHRPHLNIDEDAARRKLTHALNQLSQM